jgi:hypothetical protein
VVRWAGLGAGVVGFAAGEEAWDVVRERVVLTLGTGAWKGLEVCGCGLRGDVGRDGLERCYAMLEGERWGREVGW